MQDVYNKLEKLTKTEVTWMTFKDCVLLGKCVDVYDGDTVTLILPFGDNFYLKKCRLADLDTAEIKTKNLKEKEVAKVSKKYLEDKILNKVVYVKCFEEDKYGRLLAHIYETEKDMKTGVNSMSFQLIDKGLGYNYDGKTKKTFEEWYKEK